MHIQRGKIIKIEIYGGCVSSCWVGCEKSATCPGILSFVVVMTSMSIRSSLLIMPSRPILPPPARSSLFFLHLIYKRMRKKQITSPTKITVKESPIIAKFGPQEVIMSDTSIRNYEENDDSATNSYKRQRNALNVQEKITVESEWKKGRSPQSLEYNTQVKNKPKSPREGNVMGWKKSEENVGNIEPQIGAQARSSDQNNEDSTGGELIEKQYTFPNGDVYIGTWRGKWIEGYGVYNFNKQNLQYRGQFKKNKQHGMGVLLRKPGGAQVKEEEIYDGEWMNGEKHGLGKYTYFKDVYYDGNWVRNKKQGHGTFKSLEGQYVGEWKNDKKDGKGILKLKNGHSFEGIWVMDEFLQGHLIHSNGDTYQGEFQKFNRHGYGTYYYSNESKYRGYWQNNQKTGKGEIQYFNGDVYQGPMANNNRQGSEGQYKWKTGEEIIAEFSNDTPIRGKIRLPAQGESQFNLLK